VFYVCDGGNSQEERRKSSKRPINVCFLGLTVHHYLYFNNREDGRQAVEPTLNRYTSSSTPTPSTRASNLTGVLFKYVRFHTGVSIRGI
jgi:hypothetical protein